jgi:ribose transport system substrate-binding protein
MLRSIPLFLLALLAGCTSQTPVYKGPQKSGGDKGTLALSVLTSRNPFFNVIGETFRAEAEKAGYHAIVVSGDQDPAKQKNQVEDFLVQKVRAIVLCPCDSRAVGQPIRTANEAGVPVFTADLACLDPGAKVVTHIATDNFAGGKEAARAMVEALGEGGGKVAILDYKEAESCLQRVKGFKAAVEEHNKKQPSARIEIVAELNGGGDREIGRKAAQTLMTGQPDLSGIFAINDLSALGAWVAVHEARRDEQVKIVGFDGQPEGKKAIREGKIYADPIQYPDKIARITVQSILKYFDGEKLPPEILIPTGLYRKADTANDPEAR